MSLWGFGPFGVINRQEIFETEKPKRLYVHFDAYKSSTITS